MAEISENLLRRYHALERNTDTSDFQRRARLLQSIWREERGYEAAEYRGRLRGARLCMPEAKTTLSNYLTETIQQVVREQVEDPVRAKGKLFGRPRIYNNLLSSQPLCFNLFGELTVDLDLATQAIQSISSADVERVISIDFEYSPGRGDERYTSDRSAFDVYVSYETKRGGTGFLGIEVKYHEGLNDPVADHRTRYDEVASEMGCFNSEAMDRLKSKPLQQIWRDHLLSGAHRTVDGFDEGLFVFLYPRGNTACAQAVHHYQTCLSDDSSFEAWTLEDLVGALQRFSSASWIDAFHHRYLDFDRIPA